MRIRCLALLATACTLATLLDQGHAVPTKAAGKGKRQDNIVEKYGAIANQIIASALTGTHSGMAYEKLSEFCDKWGHRLQGSLVMERAIDDHMAVMQSEGFTATKTETTCPHWVRGEEHATLVSPLVGLEQHKIGMIGLGRSPGTGPDGITADVFVVRNFEELEAGCAQAAGKIVLFNPPTWEGYGANNQYRTQGGSRASQCGAVASLCRSVGPFSLYTPHTGSTTYEEGVTPIPTAAITIEDADLLTRMVGRQWEPRVHLYMEAQNFPDSISHNLIADLPGQEIPDEVVFMSGHMDSWDVGSGAMDDGQGWAVGWVAMNIIKDLSTGATGEPLIPPPKRTVRTIHWASEEYGSQGAEDYWNSGVQDSTKISLGMGDDNGAFTPTSFAFTGCDDARAIMEQIGTLLAPLNVTIGTGGGFEGSGLVPDVPRGTVDNDGGKRVWSEDNDDFRGNYFFFHHTEADTITMLDRSDMNLNTAVYAVISYIIADLDELLPRDDVIAEGALKGTSKHCDQAHFPDFANSSACACTVKATPSTRACSELHGWPEAESKLHAASLTAHKKAKRAQGKR